MALVTSQPFFGNGEKNFKHPEKMKPRVLGPIDLRTIMKINFLERSVHFLHKLALKDKSTKEFEDLAFEALLSKKISL